MFMPSWKVITLTPVRTTVAHWSKLGRSLRNVDTTVHIDHGDKGLRYGQVTWGTDINSHLAAIAWDWREVQPNVVAISDPMAVQSNIMLTTDDGIAISESSLVLYLNRAIHAIGWQEHVCAQWTGEHGYAAAA